MPRGRRGEDSDARIDALAARESPAAWWLEIGDLRERRDAEIDRDVAACAIKDRYASHAAAKAVAAMNGMAGALFAYECRYCLAWHLTRRPV